MLLLLDIEEKSIGAKTLFAELKFTIYDGDKIALIGRNGVGKTTLFNMIAGTDNEFAGVIERRKDARIVVTSQEHAQYGDMTPLEYVLKDAPHFTKLKHIVDTYPETMGEDMEKIHDYSEALHLFGELDYYTLEDRIAAALEAYDIPLEASLAPLSQLSGGQKRFMELVRVEFAEADLVLLDEPTNHMDYRGKEMFTQWLRTTKQSVFVITHDRDALREVTKIIEIKDKAMQVFTGNYDAYLTQNSMSAMKSITTYREGQKTLEKLHTQIQAAGARKAGSSNNRAKLLQERLQREYERVKKEMGKPSIWIDQQSMAGMDEDKVALYDRFKDRNIRIHQAGGKKEVKRMLIKADDLAVGYEAPLFEGVEFLLEHGERMFVRGRNGAGKSTLIRTLLSLIDDEKPEATVFAGKFARTPNLRVGVYEQELDPRYLKKTLWEAIRSVYAEKRLEANDEKIYAILGSYLFDPVEDKKLLVEKLSGGQKARFQIIKMLANSPNLLVLDEPTNHLDLPSIEELENALLKFDGAILYVSHDSYFVDKMGGFVVDIPPEAAA